MRKLDLRDKLSPKFTFSEMTNLHDEVVYEHPAIGSKSKAIDAILMTNNQLKRYKELLLPPIEENKTQFCFRGIPIKAKVSSPKI